MKVLVTGHLGYIGTRLVPFLRTRGHQIVGLDSDLYNRCTLRHLRLERVPQIKKDIRDIEVEDFLGFEAVIHLAALSNDPLGNLNPELTYAINYHASVRAAECAKMAGVQRFIFSSSCSTYGAAGDEMLTESADFNPVTPYGKSKVLAEKDISRLADESFSPVHMRNATAYGVSPRLRTDIVLNNLVAWAYATGEIYLKSDGLAWRPVIHVEDICRAFLAALDAPRECIHNEAFNVGINEENYRIKELAEIVQAAVPACKIVYAPDAESDRRTYRVDFSKIQRTLPAFKPAWTAPKGARELLSAYQAENLIMDEFEGPKFKRIARINRLLDSRRLDPDLRWISG